MVTGKQPSDLGKGIHYSSESLEPQALLRVALKIEKRALRKGQTDRSSDEETKVMARPTVLQLIDSSLGELSLCSASCCFINAHGESCGPREIQKTSPETLTFHYQGKAHKELEAGETAVQPVCMLEPRPHSLSWEKPGDHLGHPLTMFWRES